jgi:uncharacterized protein (TIGR02145 family)
MKKVFWVKPVFFAGILFLSACNKELPSGDLEWKPTHWPAVKTLYVTNLTSTTATLNGTVNGYGLPTTVTFEYDADTGKGDISTSYSNTVIAFKSPVIDSGIINVSADISGLTPCLVYHFRIRAENSLWKNFYGDQQSFSTIFDPNLPTTPPQIPINPDLTYGTVSDIDGNRYKTIQIGFQVWMAENLRTTRYADSSAIPLVATSDVWAGLTATDKAYCWYNWNTDCDATFYGAYYTWAAAMNGAAGSSSIPSGVQGVCPDGWHLPSNDEWTILAKFLGNGAGSGVKLKDTITWHRDDLHPATNESGFTALANGQCTYDGNFEYSGIYCFIWSSTESDHAGAVCTGYLRDISNFLNIRSANDLKEGHSVRCLKDYTSQGQAPTVTTLPATNITSTGATFNGTVNANGSPTIVEFEYYAPKWLPDPGVWVAELRRVLATQSPLTGTSSTNVSADVTGFRSETTKKFRVIATYSGGEVYGDYISFTLLK